jgi:hypothetical protein
MVNTVYKTQRAVNCCNYSTWQVLASGCMYSVDCLMAGITVLLVFAVCRCVFILIRYVQLLCVCVCVVCVCVCDLCFFMFFIAFNGRVEIKCTCIQVCQTCYVRNFPLSAQLADSAPWCYATRLATTPGTKSTKHSVAK